MDIEQIDITPEQLEADRAFLDACRALDLPAIESAVSNGCDVWFQDPETGHGPLHLVILSAHAKGVDGIEILDYLLANGGIWNQMSQDGETPGCTARRLFPPASPTYACLVSAGVRAEMLLTALEEHARTEEGAEDSHDASRNKAFLGSRLVYTAPTETSQTLLDGENNAVMMTWERDIMTESARLVVPRPGHGSVLNIGFGLGLIDTAIQDRRPHRHVIVEAHPDVLAEMRRLGWYEKQGVEILEGRWQDLVDDLANRETFDGIYYDPFEYWSDMHQFFDSVVALLNPDGVFSFFHGLGADNQTFYDVYTRILEIELSDFGMTTTFREMDVETKDEEWTGAKRRYWSLEKYRLPTCKFMQ